jgi:hypothetical protein
MPPLASLSSNDSDNRSIMTIAASDTIVEGTERHLRELLTRIVQGQPAFDVLKLNVLAWSMVHRRASNSLQQNSRAVCT